MSFRILPLSLLLWLGTMTLACTSASIQSVIFSTAYQVGDTFMGIRLHGTIELPNVEVNGIKLTELSGLAWDADEKLLYAVSDQGYLFHLRPVITDHTLTSAVLLSAFPLTNNQGKRLGNKDAEGLAIQNGDNGKPGDSKLIISFERSPTIARCTPQGKLIKRYRLPEPLRNRQNYSDSNQALEAVTRHPQFDILTTPERPLKKHSGEVIIYSLTGQQWHIPQPSAPNSAVVAMETLTDGSILILERAFVSIFRPFTISLRRIWLSACPTCPAASQPVLDVQPVVNWNNGEGWNLDNFEGLTHHQGAYFFIVSDDNDNFLQRTLLSYFELVEN